MRISRFKNWYLALAAILAVASIAIIATYGFRLGIDFTGGALWEVSAPTLSAEQLSGTVSDVTGTSVHVSKDSNTGHYLVRLGESSAETYDKVREAVQQEAQGGEFQEHSFSSIGPSVSGKLRTGAILAIVLVIAFISLYIVFSFRGATGPVKSWAYGVATLISLFHDVAIPAAVIALLGHYGQVELDTNFIVALLVVMGFSVHDTIVVFDRVRENLGKMKGSFAEVVDASVRQTVVRSLSTSFTLVLVLAALLIGGPATLHYFVLILLIGVISGAYSSIFVASPVLLTLSGGGRSGRRS